jgi:alpha,alpha-trehalose phosphorylase
VRCLREERSEDHTALVHEVTLGPEEVESWERAAAAMYVPFDEERGIHPQEATFPTGVLDDAQMRPRLFEAQNPAHATRS